MILVATRHTTLGRFRGQNADTPDKTKIPSSCIAAVWDFSGTCSQYDNDLKDHHAPMKGEALPKRLSELEELFETERDQRRIDSMRRDVEKYEQLVRRRAALNEQARMKAQEAEQLKRDAAKLKNK